NLTQADIDELVSAKIEKEANRYIQRWEAEKIAIENGRWGPFIRFGKQMIKIPNKAEKTKYTPEELIALSLEDVKKMIAMEVPDAFEPKKKTAAKKKTVKKAAKKKTK